MRKPNTALRLMARALDAQKKADLSKDKEVRAYYLGKARKAIDLAAKAKDSGKAISIIEASNKYAKIMAEEIDDVDVSEDDDGDIEVDTDEEEIDADGLDEDLDDDDEGIDPEEVLSNSDDEDLDGLDDEDLDDELDAESEDDLELDEDSDDGEDDVDSDEEIAARVARILSRKKTRR